MCEGGVRLHEGGDDTTTWPQAKRSSRNSPVVMTRCFIFARNCLAALKFRDCVETSYPVVNPLVHTCSYHGNGSTQLGNRRQAYRHHTLHTVPRPQTLTEGNTRTSTSGCVMISPIIASRQCEVHSLDVSATQSQWE